MDRIFYLQQSSIRFDELQIPHLSLLDSATHEENKANIAHELPRARLLRLRYTFATALLMNFTEAATKHHAFEML